MPAITQLTNTQYPVQVSDDSTTSSTEREAPETQKKYDVIVTGYGPFNNIIINPSFEIAKALPASIKCADGSVISVKSHPEAIRVAWETVLKLVPELYNEYGTSKAEVEAIQGDISNVPFFIHIGAGLLGKYEIEQLAHRDGYSMSDVNGKAPPPRAKLPGGGYPCDDGSDPLTPSLLETTIDVNGVVKDVQAEVTNLSMPISTSTEAGNFLCDFIFYTSLREAQLRYGKAGLSKVLFVHVPPNGALEEGIRVVSAVIRSIVRGGRAQS